MLHKFYENQRLQRVINFRVVHPPKTAQDAARRRTDQKSCIQRAEDMNAASKTSRRSA